MISNMLIFFDNKVGIQSIGKVWFTKIGSKSSELREISVLPHDDDRVVEDSKFHMHYTQHFPKFGA